jgi:putative DNA primase/helicase
MKNSRIPLDDAAALIVERAENDPDSSAYLSFHSRLDLIQASSIQPRPVQWLWDQWLAAGKLHILGGTPGSGKTTIALSIASILSSGGIWADGTKAAKGKVVIWSSEDSPEDTLVPRLMNCGADCDSISFIGNVSDRDGVRAFDPAVDIPKLREAVLRSGGVDLLIVDPIVSAVMGNDHKNSEVRRCLQPLVDLAIQLNCAVLGITHFSKNTSGRNPLERITGSLAFGALARLVWVTAKSDTLPDRRLLLKAKSNIGVDEGGYEYELIHGELVQSPGVFAASVSWGEPISGSARALLASVELPDSTEYTSATDEAEEFLKLVLSDGEVPSETVQEEAQRRGISVATLRRAKKTLGVKSEKHGMTGKWVWLLAPKALILNEDAH